VLFAFASVSLIPVEADNAVEVDHGLYITIIYVPKSSEVDDMEHMQEKRNLSVELAARIAKLLGHSPQSWLRMQEALDLWRLAQNPSRLADVEPLPPEHVAA